MMYTSKLSPVGHQCKQNHVLTSVCDGKETAGYMVHVWLKSTGGLQVIYFIFISCVFNVDVWSFCHKSTKYVSVDPLVQLKLK